MGADSSDGQEHGAGHGGSQPQSTGCVSCMSVTSQTRRLGREVTGFAAGPT